MTDWVHEDCGGRIVESDTNKGFIVFCTNCDEEWDDEDFFDQVRADEFVCACPARDAEECIEERYWEGVPRPLSHPDDACECVCHEVRVATKEN